MILLAILLQSAAVPGLPEVVTLPAPHPRVRHPVSPAVAIRTFRDVCLPNLRYRSKVAAAARRAGFRLAADARPNRVADSYVRGDTSLQYNPAGSLPPIVHQPQCSIRVWLDARVGEGAFERRFVAAVRPGALRRRQPVLIWERPDVSGAIERIGLQLDRLDHGQIVAVLSTSLRSGESEERPRPEGAE